MNNTVRYVGTGILGISFLGISLFASGCGGPSARELQLEQQVAQYQKKDEEKRQQEIIKSAVAAEMAKHNDSQPAAEFYSKIDNTLNTTKNNLDAVQKDFADIKAKQGELESKVQSNYVTYGTTYTITVPREYYFYPVAPSPRLPPSRPYIPPAPRTPHPPITPHPGPYHPR
jgi:hypothetical protein